MSRPPRGLSPEEAALWAKLAATVTPLHKPQTHGSRSAGSLPGLALPTPEASLPPARPKGRIPPPPPAPPPPAPLPRPLDRDGLDASWERKLAKAGVNPDFTLDLHGHTLDAAHARLNHGLAQAIAQQARLLLLITGRPRTTDHAARGEQRGAIRAKVLDWLAAGSYASRIAAVRQAHPRHGGAGALYIVLRREKGK